MYGYNSFYFHFFCFYIFYGFVVLSLIKKEKTYEIHEKQLLWDYCNLTRSRKSTIFFLSLPLFLLGMLRGDTVGGDLEYYIPYFDEMCRANKISDIWSISGHEPGYQLFTYFISRISHSHICFFIFTSVASLAGPVFLIYRYSRIPFFSFFLYYALGFYTNTFNNVRQSIAISIVFIALYFLFNRKKFKYAFFVILATLFHYSAIISVLFYFIVNNRITIKKVFLYLGGGVCIYILASISIISFLLNILAFKYDAESTLLNSEGAGWSMLSLYIIIMIGELFLYKSRIMVSNKDKERVSFFIQLQLIAVLCQMFAPLFASMVRMTYYFFIPQIIVIPYLIKTYRPMKSIIVIVSITFAILYMGLVYGENKEIKSNSQGVIPYVLIDNVIY